MKANDEGVSCRVPADYYGVRCAHERTHELSTNYRRPN